MEITMKQYDITVSWKIERDDLNTDDVLDAVKGLMIALTYKESSIISSMKEIAEEYEDLQRE